MKRYQGNSDTLLVLHSATLGGPTSSAINLLRLLREAGRPIDVFLMDHDGPRTADLAAEGNLLPRDPFLADAITGKQNVRSAAQYLRRGGYVLSHKLLGAKRARARLFARAAKRLGSAYKNVIAYQESVTTDFVRYIDTPNRIGWMHTDFDRLRALAPSSASRETYDAYHHIASVTKASADRMIEVLSRDPETVHVIRNPLIAASLVERSREEIPAEEARSKPLALVSVGRLSPEKAFVRIPRVASKLKAAGVDFEWTIIGDGTTRGEIEREIAATETGDVVRLLGARMNPYPYVRVADLLVITSEYEAQPMVANEALILDTPVLSTEFASVREVIKDGANGMIVAQSEDAIAEAILSFVGDEVLRATLAKGAADFRYSNEGELAAITALLS